MRRLLARWLLLTLALLVTIKALPLVGLTGVEPGPIPRLFLASLAIAALNLLAHPLLWIARLMTAPLSCLTLGLWSLFLGLFVNALVFYFIGNLDWGFHVTGILPAFLGALALSLVSAFLNGVFALSVRKDNRGGD